MAGFVVPAMRILCFGGAFVGVHRVIDGRVGTAFGEAPYMVARLAFLPDPDQPEAAIAIIGRTGRVVGGDTK